MLLLYFVSFCCSRVPVSSAGTGVSVTILAAVLIYCGTLFVALVPLFLLLPIATVASAVALLLLGCVLGVVAKGMHRFPPHRF